MTESETTSASDSATSNHCASSLRITSVVCPSLPEAKKVYAITFKRLYNISQAFLTTRLWYSFPATKSTSNVSEIDSSVTSKITWSPEVRMEEGLRPRNHLIAPIAAQKYGGRITLTGSGAFREQAARAATRLGITVLDKDLASIVSNERQVAQYQGHKPSRNTTHAVNSRTSRGKGNKGNER